MTLDLLLHWLHLLAAALWVGGNLAIGYVVQPALRKTLEPRQRMADFLSAAESAALRDALDMARFRFDSVYLIAPTHNPVGAFDFRGAYDEASDRHQGLDEVMKRAYEDAYHQFIEPVVGASGERLAQPDTQTANIPH